VWCASFSPLKPETGMQIRPCSRTLRAAWLARLGSASAFANTKMHLGMCVADSHAGGERKNSWEHDVSAIFYRRRGVALCDSGGEERFVTQSGSSPAPLFAQEAAYLNGNDATRPHQVDTRADLICAPAAAGGAAARTTFGNGHRCMQIADGKIARTPLPHYAVASTHTHVNLFLPIWP